MWFCRLCTWRSGDESPKNACSSIPIGLAVHQHLLGGLHQGSHSGTLHEPPGRCHDNAVAESFFTLLKRERIRRRTYKTREEARLEVFDYIEMFYKPFRKHVRYRMLSPVEFQRQQAVMAQGV